MIGLAKARTKPVTYVLRWSCSSRRRFYTRSKPQMPSAKGLNVTESAALLQMTARREGASYSQSIETNPLCLPGVAFAFRFGNEDGFVHRFFALYRDLVARELCGSARCLFAFAGRLGDDPVYPPHWAEEVQENLYDNSLENRERIKNFVMANRIA